MIEGVFRDRDEAGAALAEAVRSRGSCEPATVLAIPRGGVAVAVPVARALGAPLDVVIPRKLGAPGNPELAIGAVAPGVRVLHERAVRQLRVPAAYIEGEAAPPGGGDRAPGGDLPRRPRAGAGRRPHGGGRSTTAWRPAPPPSPRSDGRARPAPSRVVFAAPVGPPAARARLEAEADEVVLLREPFGFLAVGEWYRDFDQVTDDEVVAMLRELRA